jgi:hypothetical protein
VLISRTEKYQFRTEKCQLRTEKCQLRTEKYQLRTEKCQLRTEKCQLRAEKSHLLARQGQVPGEVRHSEMHRSGLPLHCQIRPLYSVGRLGTPFNTVCLPLNCSGNPGEKVVYLKRGCSVQGGAAVAVYLHRGVQALVPAKNPDINPTLPIQNRW